MNSELLEIQPREIRIIFELGKQSSCSIRLVNKSDHHVAFKIKTTSSSKYCVRPNIGVIKPARTCDLTVTMQAQNVAPPDLICNDKFLIQSAIVPDATTEDFIMSSTFAKEDGKHIEEKKLKVILVSPSHSPILSPMNGISRMRPYIAATDSSDDLVQNNCSHAKVAEVMQNEQVLNRKHTEELRLSNDVEEMKSKLREFESTLKQENMRTNQNTRAREIGLRLLFISVVALVSAYLGYLLHG